MLPCVIHSVLASMACSLELPLEHSEQANLFLQMAAAQYQLTNGSTHQSSRIRLSTRSHEASPHQSFKALEGTIAQSKAPLSWHSPVLVLRCVQERTVVRQTGEAFVC